MGNTRTKNKIAKFGLEDTILEMYSRGLSFNQIINEVMIRSGVQLSKSSVSRYISRSMTSKTIIEDYNSFSEVRHQYTSNTNTTLNHIDAFSTEILASIDTSKRKAMAEKLNALRKEYILNRNELVMVFDKLYEDKQITNIFLADLSKDLCISCKTKLLEHLHKYEQCST